MLVTYPLPHSPYNRTIYIGKNISINSGMLDILNTELANSNEIIESLEITISSENGSIGSYNMGLFVYMTNYTLYQQNISGNTSESTITIPVEIAADKQSYLNSASNTSLGYWWGDNQSLTIESIKVNYRVVKGDIDKNGEVNANDLSILRKFMVGSSTDVSFEDADLNNDGQLNVFDCIILERMIG